MSYAVDNDVVKKTVCNELVKKVIAIQTTETSDLVKKTDYNTKMFKIEKKTLNHNLDKYITTQEFNKLTKENFAARLKEAKLATKDDIGDFVKKKQILRIK